MLNSGLKAYDMNLKIYQSRLESKRELQQAVENTRKSFFKSVEDLKFVSDIFEHRIHYRGE